MLPSKEIKVSKKCKNLGCFKIIYEFILKVILQNSKILLCKNELCKSSFDRDS